MALVVVGLVQGLVFFPVLLSLVGPVAEVVGVEHDDRISPPSPEPTFKRGATHPAWLRVSKAPRTPRSSRFQSPGQGLTASLTTITEEPSWHSSVQSIVVQPEIVMTTTSESSPDPPRVTKVTATAKLKVELHAPTPIKTKSRRRESRDSTSSDGSDKT